jgi:hypothetical protein
MPKVNLKGNLEDSEFEKFKELRKKLGSQIEVLRFLLRENMYNVSLTYEDKEKMRDEIENLKKEFEDLKIVLDGIDERLSVIINILSFKN